MLIKSHEQLNQAVCEIFFSSQLSKMGYKSIELSNIGKENYSMTLFSLILYLIHQKDAESVTGISV